MDNEEKIKILFGRTKELWWDGLLRLLHDVQDFDIVAVCSNTTETIKQAASLLPEVILLDEEIAGGDRKDVAMNIRDLHEDTKIIVIIKPYKDVELASHFKARAKAYIDKDLSLEELITAIRCVARGGMVVISRTVSQEILKNLESAGNIVHKVRPEYNIYLSKRELEVLNLLAKQKMSNKEIAQALFITENTVKSHLGSILEKMKVKTREQAASLAKDAGIVKLDSN
jgi:DNA-binding NarL/FixJ family response regulator